MQTAGLAAAGVARKHRLEAARPPPGRLAPPPTHSRPLPPPQQGRRHRSVSPSPQNQKPRTSSNESPDSKKTSADPPPGQMFHALQFLVPPEARTTNQSTEAPYGQTQK
ncbi:hypothetical protein BV898_16487 [Hypsibius exemplaris]|uniref:Uncharacterized protein n=1 Tax=Hypsibius exemplaris TaxID=2072580 RepID=A0A9X6NKB2_HYPEX|nr:hypothetical protein BV898_16487 [Hypsibius exemplaris]